MGTGVLVIGESGTGKSSSLRNFEDNEISLVNVEGKPLPFRNSFKKVIHADTSTAIINAMMRASSKVIVIDDVQYVMANEFMRRAKETGFTKFTEIGFNFFNIIEAVKKLPADVIVYFLGHTSVDKSGTVRFKTVGKLLDEKITIEGKFTIVLKTIVSDGQYLFSTRNNGRDTVKSPQGMFESAEIPNDLKAVDTAIRAYYNMGVI